MIMKVTLYTCLALMLMASNCKDATLGEVVYRIQVKNNSTQTIRIAERLGFPDTIPHKEMLVYTLTLGKDVLLDSKKKWDKVINDDIPGKKLQVFVFSVVKTTPQWNWDSVITKYQVLKRYELTADELKAMNNIINYP